MIDFSKLSINKAQAINPRDIFMRLTNKASKYQYPRDVQSEVWKQWFEQRNNKDTIIKMNTGSGKTVVALMILQSCLNEGFGPAMYVVPDRYLVKQVEEQAKELGIKIVQSETDLDYQRKKGILVTTIQKLVNGKSVFGLRRDNNYEIGSVIIDDMHACISSIQEQFSITIPKGEKLYDEIIKIFAEELNKQSKGRLSDIIFERNIYECMLIPFWSWQENNDRVYRLLSDNQDKEFIKFKFDLLKDCLELSHCYISSSKIDIIPNCTPIHRIKSFEDAKRRIYMSATLPDDSPFATVLGVEFGKNTNAIAPEKANDIGERLIVVPKLINKDILDDEVRNGIMKMSKQYNVVVLVPSFAQAKCWKDGNPIIISAENIIEGVEQIKKSNSGLYVFVNRYDGIDLPDDACRILVIDGLPNISNLNDRYETEVVRKSERIHREQIQRIEQGMGRGVRSNSDYCFVILLGARLTDMLYTDNGYHYFSNATKAQFELSENLCEQIENGSCEDILSMGDFVLKRNSQWMTICKESTIDLNYSRKINISKVAEQSRKAFNNAVIGDYLKSKTALEELVNSITDSKVKGYYKQLLAEYVNFLDRSEAQQILKSAKRDNMEILNPIEGIQFIKMSSDIPEQSRMIVDYINSNKLDENKLVLHVDHILSDLKFESGSSKHFEAALKDIFEILGYVSTRPEHEVGKGPDNFVILGSGDYLVIECKNETITDTINKHDCNQLNGSYNWFRALYKDEQVRCVPIMIHHSNIFEYACSPNKEIRIMTPNLLDLLKDRIREFTVALCQKNNFKNIERINGLLKEYKLNKGYIVSEYTKLYTTKNK